MTLARAIAEQPPQMVKDLRNDWNVSMGVPIADGHRIHMDHGAKGGYRGSTAADIAAKREAVIARAKQQRGQL
jgi:hypothetical protein